MHTINKDYDIIIIGAGMVGATLACLLADSHYRIAVIERATPTAFSSSDPLDLRVSAISRFSQQALQDAGAWQTIQSMRAAPYERMFVWDGSGEGKIAFDAAEIGEPNLGHIIENRVIQLALIEAMQSHQVDLISPAHLETITTLKDNITIKLDNQQSYQCQLVVGADGAQSLVRRLAKIDSHENDYAEKGLVATIETEQPHQSTAWQRFMPTGPLAVLPFAAPHQSSIVWTLPADQADYLLAMDDTTFNKALATAFDHKLGAMKVLSQRAAFPLLGRHANQYVHEHIALIGDAAHTIHPLAGQGVNLGIKDAVELAKTIKNSNKALGSYRQLRYYERARKGDNHLTQKTMEGLSILFGHSTPLVNQGRNYGLQLINTIKPIKNKIIRHAMGLN